MTQSNPLLDRLLEIESITNIIESKLLHAYSNFEIDSLLRQKEKLITEKVTLYQQLATQLNKEKQLDFGKICIFTGGPSRWREHGDSVECGNCMRSIDKKILAEIVNNQKIITDLIEWQKSLESQDEDQSISCSEFAEILSRTLKQSKLSNTDTLRQKIEKEIKRLELFKLELSPSSNEHLIITKQIDILKSLVESEKK